MAGVADQLRPKVPKLAALMDAAETDVLAYMGFPAAHRAKLHSTNPLERLNGEIKRRTEVVGIFPDERAIRRLVGAILLEQNDEWAVQRCRYMTLESIAPIGDDPSSACQTSQSDQSGPAVAVVDQTQLHHALGHDPKQPNPTPDGFVQVMRRYTVANCATIVYKIVVDRQRRTSVSGRHHLLSPHFRAYQRQAPLLWHPYALAPQQWCGVPPTGRHTMFTNHTDPAPFVSSLTTSRRVDITPHALAHALEAAFLSTRAPECESDIQSRSTSTSALKVEAQSPSAANQQASANVDLFERNADRTGN